MAAPFLLSTLLALAIQASPVPQGGPPVDNEGGASGSDGSAYNISKGGIVAIIVVAVVVGVFGITSTVLFIVAKRRQWEVRKTLKRASRRVTSRMSSSRSRRQSMHGAVRMREPGAAPRFQGSEKGNPAASAKTATSTKEKRHATLPPPERVEAAKTGSGNKENARKEAPRGGNGRGDDERRQPQQQAIELQDAPQDGKRWKAIMPPSWSMGRKSGGAS